MTSGARILPTVLGGHPKSGTTLLTALLDGHPELTVFPEELAFFGGVFGRGNLRERLLETTGLSHILAGGARVTRAAKDVRDYRSIDPIRLRQELDARLGEARDERDAYLAVVRAWSAVRGAKDPIRWVEKTPWSEEYFRIYGQWFGRDVTYLYMLRHPFDTWAAYRRKHPDWTVDTFALSWLYSTELALAAVREMPNFHIVYYHDLVTSTESTMRHICGLMGVDFHSATLRPTRGGNPWAGNSMHGYESTAVHSSGIDTHKSLLPDSERDRLEKLLAYRMHQLGYPATSADRARPDPLIWARLRVRMARWSILKGSPDALLAARRLRGIKEHMMPLSRRITA